MGIFPYATPIEHSRLLLRIKHYEAFCKLKGYEKIQFPKIYFPPYKGQFLAKNGIIYEDCESFHKAIGRYPHLIKDGVCYGFDYPRYNDEYKDPWDSEIEFLIKCGYERISFNYSKDYLENNELEEKFFKDNGFVPRWIKNDVKYGHEQALKLEKYKYEGYPPLDI